MNESILDSVKKVCGINYDYTAFDEEIILHTNSILMVINQIGIGGDRPFVIHGEEEAWSDFLEDDSTIEAVKTYVGLRVKVIFDHTLSSSVVNSINEITKELEWRLYVIADSGGTENVSE